MPRLWPEHLRSGWAGRPSPTKSTTPTTPESTSEQLLSDAAALRPLPDEMPAAALWSRLELQTPTPNISDRTRPTRTADERAVFDEHTTEQASTDPPQPHIAAAVDHTPDIEPILDALGMLTDAELEQHIDELHLHIALAETDAIIYSPYTQAPNDDERDAEAAAHHQQAAKQAIRDAQTSINELRAAEQSLQAVTTELDHARTTLSSTPAYRRGQRRALHTQITTLQTEQQHRAHARNSAHTSARNAQRDALRLAGPAEDWEHILTQPVTEPTSTTPSEPTYGDTLTAEYQQELDQLQSEQHRRTQLTPTQTAYANNTTPPRTTSPTTSTTLSNLTIRSLTTISVCNQASSTTYCA
ncbi:hypothetical protein AB0M12_07715 [Nocardia vinacea]|uniref:hypothetical protein n=1 Tax=Nocardia vinacea TaxID=96468 RepID=UPI00342F5F7D